MEYKILKHQSFLSDVVEIHVIEVDSQGGRRRLRYNGESNFELLEFKDGEIPEPFITMTETMFNAFRRFFLQDAENDGVKTPAEEVLQVKSDLHRDRADHFQALFGKAFDKLLEN